MSLRTAAMLVLAAAALAACATTPLQPQRVARSQRPVSAAARAEAQALARPRLSCVPKGLGPRPRYPDTDAALRGAPGAADRYQLMAAGRLLREKRLDELERVVDGCR